MVAPKPNVKLWGSKQVKKKPLAEFFQFLQCQLRMEARECIGDDMELQDPEAQSMWERYEQFVRPNLPGKREKWMPFHTVLGAHEFFAVCGIQNAKEKLWDSKRRFLVTFIYRAHCKSDFFEEAQLPHLQKEAFWEDPVSQFEPGGAIVQAMLDYRRKTQRPLQTGAFLCVPARICQDDDENLVVNIAKRTQTLLQVAEDVWPVLTDGTKSTAEKFEEISSKLRKGEGIGGTWAKMLMVSIDIANPKIGLLAERCEVGTGAVGGLRRLMAGFEDAKAALQRVTAHANRARSLPSVCHFWSLLPQVEKLARHKYADVPLILEQMQTQLWNLPAVTVQVQLCEWRQFDDYLRKPEKRKQKSSSKESSGRTVPQKSSHSGRRALEARPNKRPRTSEVSDSAAKHEVDAPKRTIVQSATSSSSTAASVPPPLPSKVLDRVIAESEKAKGQAESTAVSAQQALDQCRADCESASSRRQQSISDVEVAAKELRAAEEKVTEAERRLDKARCEQRACESSYSNLQAARRAWQAQNKAEDGKSSKTMPLLEQFPRHVKALMQLAHNQEEVNLKTALKEMVNDAWEQAVSDVGQQINQASVDQTSAGRQAKEALEYLTSAQECCKMALEKYGKLQLAHLEAERDFRDVEQLVRVNESIVRIKREEAAIATTQAKHVQVVSERILACIQSSEIS